MITESIAADFLRLVVHLVPRSSENVEILCEVISSNSRGKTLEIWVKCRGLEDLLKSLELLLVKGYIVAIGGLNGSFVEGIPANLADLEHLGKQDSILSPGSFVEIEFRNPKSPEILIGFSEILEINYQTHKARAKLSKPLRISSLFDRGIRVVKPIKIPP